MIAKGIRQGRMNAHYSIQDGKGKGADIEKANTGVGFSTRIALTFRKGLSWLPSIIRRHFADAQIAAGKLASRLCNGRPLSLVAEALQVK